LHLLIKNYSFTYYFKGMMTVAIKNPELIPVYCTSCKRFLIQAPLESYSMCPDCGIWVKTEAFKSKPEGKED
jgi:predicted RNA-binding Zn-ribbon protein involved in translation (DUF1610 family)